MASTIRSILSSLISPTVKASCPKRIGTRTNELLLNCGAFPSCSTILHTKSLMAFDPISIAAYFFMLIIRNKNPKLYPELYNLKIIVNHFQFIPVIVIGLKLCPEYFLFRTFSVPVFKIFRMQPCFYITFPANLKSVYKLLLYIFIINRTGNLYPFIKVTCHKIGRRDKHFRLSVIPENINP